MYGLFGDKDELVDTYDMFHEHYPLATHFHGEHRMDDRSFMHAVVPVIRWIDDRQEGRQRPVVYIGVETMTDANSKPASSCQKAVRRLIEAYQVYFLAPTERMSETVVWLEEYVNVPAWRHTIFTNQRHLLYGDYMIAADNDSNDADNSLCTIIDFGSDTFKTWEDILDYFDRLGGQ